MDTSLVTIPESRGNQHEDGCADFVLAIETWPHTEHTERGTMTTRIEVRKLQGVIETLHVTNTES